MHREAGSTPATERTIEVERRVRAVPLGCRGGNNHVCWPEEAPVAPVHGCHRGELVHMVRPCAYQGADRRRLHGGLIGRSNRANGARAAPLWPRKPQGTPRTTLYADRAPKTSILRRAKLSGAGTTSRSKPAAVPLLCIHASLIGESRARGQRLKDMNIESHEYAVYAYDTG